MEFCMANVAHARQGKESYWDASFDASQSADRCKHSGFGSRSLKPRFWPSQLPRCSWRAAFHAIVHESGCIAAAVAIRYVRLVRLSASARLSTCTRLNKRQCISHSRSALPSSETPPHPSRYVHDTRRTYPRRTHDLPRRTCMNTNLWIATERRSGSSPSSLAPGMTCSAAHSNTNFSTPRHHHTTKRFLTSAETKRKKPRLTSMAAKLRFRQRRKLPYAVCAAKTDRGSYGSTRCASMRTISQSEVTRSE